MHPSSNRRLSLGTVARLADIASQLGRHAVGMDLKPAKATEPVEENLDAWATRPKEELERRYGGSAAGAADTERNRNVADAAADL